MLVSKKNLLLLLIRPRDPVETDLIEERRRFQYFPDKVCPNSAAYSRVVHFHPDIKLHYSNY